MNIENHIPVGHKNAISRLELKNRTGKNDRINRKMIENHNNSNDNPIINAGEGYFIPDRTSTEDLTLLKEYINIKKARISSRENSLYSSITFLNNNAITAYVNKNVVLMSKQMSREY